jgi:hypothetical protein
LSGAARQTHTFAANRESVMDAPNEFEIVGDRGVFRPTGSMSLQQAVDLVTAAITFARERGLQDLFVNAAAVVGFPSPTISERYFLAEQWAHATGVVRFAIVVRAEMIDPKKFGMTVARNRGMVCDVFSDETEAVAWLDGLR